MKLFIVLATVFLTGCSGDTILLPDLSPRVSDLERRMQLNEQLDAVQSSLIQANSDAIEAETASRVAGDQALQSLLDAETQARIDGDQAQANALAIVVVSQTVVNVLVQAQLASINSKFPVINNKLNSLQSQVNATNSNLNALAVQVSQLNADMLDLELRQDAIEADLLDLRDDLTATQNQLDQQGVQLFKCDSPSSTERIMKINGRYYGVMNRVTTEVVQVVTGSSSTTYTNPKLCLKDEKAKLPGGNGECPSNWTEFGGNTVIVPSYSTASKTVMTSVKMALDLLTDGSYVTTDGGPSCSFSISGGGYNQTGLIPVQ